MTLRPIHVTDISAAEREAWPIIAPFCGEPRSARHDPLGREPAVIFGVYAAHEREKAVLHEWITGLRGEALPEGGQSR
jgi:hypothetical protein